MKRNNMTKEDELKKEIGILRLKKEILELQKEVSDLKNEDFLRDNPFEPYSLSWLWDQPLISTHYQYPFSDITISNTTAGYNTTTIGNSF